MTKGQMASLILFATLAMPTGEARAQQSPASACADPDFHQFDFWIGSWEVTAQGKAVGRNEIVPFAQGCALLENWTAANGSVGKSINTWRPTEKRWTQHWVSAGTILDLSGGLVDGQMVLTGPVRQLASGPVMDRVTWTPVTRDQVRQVWELSSDNGTTWRTIFDGTYTRKKRE